MSHTTKIRGSGFAEAWVNHNSDWSGDAIVCWTTEPSYTARGPDNTHHVTVPGKLLKAFLVHHVSDEIEEATVALMRLAVATGRKV